MSDHAPVPIPDRLKRGAAMLGGFWLKGIRCSEEWGILCDENDPTKAVDCFCEPKTPFCKAKMQWLEMAVKAERAPIDGEFGLVEMMTGSEFDASGLTVKIDFPGVGVHGIGPKGVMGRDDIVKLFEAPDTLASVVRLMKSFPGLKVEEVEEPAAVEPVATEADFWEQA